ncbi:MAG: inner membrane CreD family protein [Polyangiaceae bacterium]|nr:inner membrane CreD family protein [Polyangiaceae bacterium]MCL4749941.1 inner membrane CreD family protein [Myxococcales bacterium]
MRRLLAIGLIWLGCSLAWLVLGSTLLVRSDETFSRLGDGVFALWGPPMRQLPPRAVALEPRDPAAAPATAAAARDVPLAGSDIEVTLDLEHRKKGLVWFPTYGVDFRARYSFENPDAASRDVTLELPLESEHALYDGFDVTEDDKSVGAEVKQGVARWTTRLAPHQKKSYEVRYRSRGTSRWQYDLTSGTGNVRDFRLALSTDFEEVNFLPGTLSPSKHETGAGGWRGSWEFKTLVASSPIGLALPERINPGPLASKITFFAPVSLLFFFFVVAILAHAQKKLLHPLHYLFLGCAFFAFHLLFAYLVDHVSIAPSFAIAAAVSTALVVSYARLFVGWRFALREIGVSQLLYLVLFSFTFFWTGFTGLAITVGAILTLFVLMQITGRRDLSEGESSLEPHAACATPYRCAVARDARESGVT